MALTLAECKSLIEHALHGRAPSNQLDAARLTNRTGTWFCGAHRWGWLERPATGLNFVAGQTFCSLPSDFSEVISVEVAGIVGCFTMTSTGELNTLRSASVDASGLSYWGAVRYTAGSVSGPPTPVLDLYPTPAANSTSALNLYYRAGWVNISADTDRVIIPPWCEMAFIDALQATTLGLEVPGEGSMASRLHDVRMGSLREAIDLDMRAQTDYGPIINGAAAGGYSYSWSGYTVSDPS